LILFEQVLIRSLQNCEKIIEAELVMTPDHDLGMHGDGHPKPPPQGENTLLSTGRKRTRACAAQRILVVAPQPFYGDRGTPIALEVDRLPKQIGISPRLPIVLYTGTFKECHGLSTLIGALPAMLPRIQFQS